MEWNKWEKYTVLARWTVRYFCSQLILHSSFFGVASPLFYICLFLSSAVCVPLILICYARRHTAFCSIFYYFFFWFGWVYNVWFGHCSECARAPQTLHTQAYMRAESEQRVIINESFGTSRSSSSNTQHFYVDICRCTRSGTKIQHTHLWMMVFFFLLLLPCKSHSYHHQQNGITHIYIYVYIAMRLKESQSVKNQYIDTQNHQTHTHTHRHRPNIQAHRTMVRHPQLAEMIQSHSLKSAGHT